METHIEGMGNFIKALETQGKVELYIQPKSNPEKLIWKYTLSLESRYKSPASGGSLAQMLFGSDWGIYGRGETPEDAACQLLQNMTDAINEASTPSEKKFWENLHANVVLCFWGTNTKN